VLPAGSSGPVSGQATIASPTFTLHLKKEGIIATAREVDGEFTVLQGSHARQSWIGTPHAYKALHEALVKDGVLVPDPAGGLLVFARDYVFASPSAAAAVITGRNANGRIEWRIQGSGMTFGDWQLRDIDSGPSSRARDPVKPAASADDPAGDLRDGRYLATRMRRRFLMGSESAATVPSAAYTTRSSKLRAGNPNNRSPASWPGLALADSPEPPNRTATRTDPKPRTTPTRHSSTGLDTGTGRVCSSGNH
jgi:uncharacterized protein DUF4357